MKDRATCSAPRLRSSRRPKSLRRASRRERSPPETGSLPRHAQVHRRDADRDIEPGLTGYRERLQRNGAIGSADEHIRAQPRRHGHFATGAVIISGEEAGTGDGLGENRPDHETAPGDAEVEPKLGDGAVVVLAPA